MESRESAERASSMRHALIISLHYGYTKRAEHTKRSSLFYTCSQVLYRRGAQLGQVGLDHLRFSLVWPRDSLSSAGELSWTTQLYPSYEARETTAKPPLQPSAKNEQSRHTMWSHWMMSMDWMQRSDEKIECDWLRSFLLHHAESSGDDVIPVPDVILICEDGDRILAHSDALIAKSAKLAAAINFSTMARSKDIHQIEVSMSRDECQRMLQHIYYGSIVASLPENAQELTTALLDLVLIGEEFICPGLVQECEMRLLSRRPRRCVCSQCNRAKEDCWSYRAAGPSALITPDTALDVLAIAQHGYNAYHGSEHGYQINIGWYRTFTSLWTPMIPSISIGPLEALKEAALRCLLLDFDAVSRTSSFLQHQESSETSQQAEWLLHSCLEEYASSPATSYDSRGHLALPKETTSLDCAS